MQVKNDLRKIYKEKRKELQNKNLKDIAVSNNLFSMKEFLDASLVLSFASLDDEINTDKIIEKSLEMNKKVALPYCVDKNGNMDYYYINSFDDLISGNFGVREPNINICKKVIDFSNSICIVPGLTFDEKGYRLGYGKGYYDRFIEKCSSTFIGLCYNDFIIQKIPTDKYDLPVDFIVTNEKIIKI